MSREAPKGARDYETTQLIPYLGNKRALVPRFRVLFRALADGVDRPLFLDPFAGSGSVSRLARTLGMRVKANDWEPYAYALNRAWLVLRESDLRELWADEGGINAVLDRLNAFHPARGDRYPDPEPEPYMALWYAPRDTSRADWRTERLFYTRENAVFLDRVREHIERTYPRDASENPDSPRSRRRDLLLALLVLEAAVHANTSGVFKAFHKGFGGHGRDALPRILGAMELERPILPEAEPAEVFREDAVSFVRGRSADIVYLDPPYNQHQYGSNYHLLNTLVRWDRLPVPLEPGPDGRLLRKAGIPPGWRETWSPFCGRTDARDALATLVGNVDARTLVLSYNTEGLVSPEELFDLLSERWEVRPEILDYVRYRGGRQSGSRRVRNHELVYVCRERAARGGIAGKAGLARLRTELRLRRLLASRFEPGLVVRAFGTDGVPGSIPSPFGSLRMWRFHRFEGPLPGLETADIEDLDRLARELEACEVTDHARAVRVLAGLARECADSVRARDLADARRAAREALSALRKLAHPRYLREFEEAEKTLRDLAAEFPALAERLEPGLERLAAQRAERLRHARG